MWLDLGSRKLLRIARGFGLPKPLEGWLEDELPGAFLTEPRLDFRRSEPSRAASPKLILVGSPLLLLGVPPLIGVPLFGLLPPLSDFLSDLRGVPMDIPLGLIFPEALGLALRADLTPL